MKLLDQAKKTAKAKGLMDTAKAAKFLGYTVHALKKWRVNGTGPSYFRLKGGLIYYAKADLEKYKQEITLVRVEPTPRPATRTA